MQRHRTAKDIKHNHTVTLVLWWKPYWKR